MNRIKNRLALITGASSGIGKEIAKIFASNGVNLILVARRKEKLLELKKELSQNDISIKILVFDVRDREDVIKKLNSLDITPDILINSAGLASGISPIQSGDFEDWDKMIDTNVKGLLNVTRTLLPKMIENGDGHIINIGSIAGHHIYPNGNIYNATKFAVKGLTEAMNSDLLDTDIKVSSVDPGAVETEFSIVRFHGDIEKANNMYKGYSPLTPEDIADSVYYVANLPKHVNIPNLIIMPSAQRNVWQIKKEI